MGSQEPQRPTASHLRTSQAKGITVTAQIYGLDGKPVNSAAEAADQEIRRDLLPVLKLLVKQGYVAELAGGKFGLTVKGARAAAILMQLGIMDATREEEDVDETLQLHAYLLTGGTT